MRARDHAFSTFAQPGCTYGPSRRVDECIARLLRPLIDGELSVVFYDLSTICTEGLREALRMCAGTACPRKAQSPTSSCSAWCKRRMSFRFSTRSCQTTQLRPPRLNATCKRCWLDSRTVGGRSGLALSGQHRGAVAFETTGRQAPGVHPRRSRALLRRFR